MVVHFHMFSTSLHWWKTSNLCSQYFWIFSCIYSEIMRNASLRIALLLSFFSVIGRKRYLNLYCYAFLNVLNFIAWMEKFNLSTQDFWSFSCIYSGRKCKMHHYASHHFFHFSQLLEETDTGICIVRHFWMFWTPLHWWKTSI